MIPKEFKTTIELKKGYDSYLAQYDYNEIPEQLAHLPSSEEQEKEYEASQEYKSEKGIKDSFTKEYKKHTKAKNYFLGCTHSSYTANYDNRLKAFKSNYEDAMEHDFIHEELKAIIFFSLPLYIDEKLIKSINYSLERTKEFLINRLEDELGFKVTFSMNNDGLQTLSIKSAQKDLSIKKMDNSTLKWKGDITHLVELGMALIVSDSINVGKGKLSENKFYELLAKFFNIEKLYHEKYKKDVRKRVKDATVFIPLLDEALKKDIFDRLK